MPEPDSYRDLLSDLAAEHEALDTVVAPLDASTWSEPTPAEGWTVADCIGHLLYFDGAAARSASDPAAFAAERDALLGSLTDASDLDGATLGHARSLRPDALLGEWRAGRAAMLGALAVLDAKARLEWYGPPMSAMSFATARLMETWAHGQDVVDAVGGSRPATDRLRHIAHLGVRTRGFSFVVHGLEPPAVDDEVEVVLTAPSGAVWSWGPSDAPGRVTGPAEDFCLVVTQRRNLADTALVVEGGPAESWMAVAQAFAGGPGAGRAPLGGGASHPTPR